MLIPQDVYDQFYDDVFLHFITYVVLPNEGYNQKNGKRYSLKSPEWWNITRTENEKTVWIAQKILNGLTACTWEFYRFKRHYRYSKMASVGVQKIDGIKYKEIDMRYFFNALDHMNKYALPENFDFNGLPGVATEEKGKALLTVYLIQEHPDFLTIFPGLNWFENRYQKLNYNIFPATDQNVIEYEQISSKSFRSRQRNAFPKLDDLNNAAYHHGNLISDQVMPRIQKEIHEFVNKYFTCLSKLESWEALEMWEPCARKEIFNDFHMNLRYLYFNSISFDKVHLWDFHLQMNDFSNLHAECNLFFVENAFEIDFSFRKDLSVWSIGHREFLLNLNQQLTKIGRTAQNIGKEIFGITIKYPDYDGIYSPKVQSIIRLAKILDQTVKQKQSNRFVKLSLENKNQEWYIKDIYPISINNNYTTSH